MIDERRRLLLHRRLEELLGTSEAATLMEHLPPVGWADVATKHDLEQLGVQFRAELNSEIQGLRGEMYKAFADQTRTFVSALVFSVLGAVATSAGLAFAAARLAG